MVLLHLLMKSITHGNNISAENCLVVAYPYIRNDACNNERGIVAFWAADGLQGAQAHQRLQRHAGVPGAVPSGGAHITQRRPTAGPRGPFDPFLSLPTECRGIVLSPCLPRLFILISFGQRQTALMHSA